LVKAAQGMEIFRESEERVGAIKTHPERKLCVESQRMIKYDAGRFVNARILMQRQILRVVPVSECHWTYKNKSGRFWVYGNENKVECKDYPQTCCWGCSIL